MAVNEYHLKSSEFVQHWVNSLPPLQESHLYQTATAALSSPSTSNSSYEATRGETYSSSHGIPDAREYCLSQSSNVDASAHSQAALPNQRELRSSLPSKGTDKKCLHRKNSRLSWMHSNYSSFNSETSSIEFLLDERKADPEEVLMNLGFGVTNGSIASRLPSRFLVSRTHANGIDMQGFVQGHPELSRYMAPETNLAMGELERRLPHYYRQVAVTDSHTSLHKQFSSSSLELQGEQAFTPFTVHEGEDGTTFSSILSKSNTEQLARQGFYSEHSPAESAESPAKNSSVSSLSTHDCTIDSVDTPSPILLNNSPSPSPSSTRNPFITSQSSGSDSVFSSTESYMMDQRLRVKLEAIHEKSLHEISDEDLEEGISFISRRRSDGDLAQQQDILCQAAEDKQVSIHKRRKAFARTKSRSFDEEGLSQMLRDKLVACQPESSSSQQSKAPVIVTTPACQDPGPEPVVPKQAEGLLQVMFIPESFDSVDSDAGTIVPSPYASPCQGMSPNTSRNGSLSVLPATESFELEEVQSTAESNPVQSTRLKRARLQRSVSQRSDSDSSGIADVDCKSSQGQNDNPGSSLHLPSSQHLELPKAFSSPSTKASVATVQNAASRRTRRSSDSDASDLKYCSLSSEPSSASGQGETAFTAATVTNKKDIGTQTEVFSCCYCGRAGNEQILSKYNKEWRINNPAHTTDIGARDPSTVPSNICSRGAISVAVGSEGDSHHDTIQPKFFIVNGETQEDESLIGRTFADSNEYLSDGPYTSSSSHEADSRVDDLCYDMVKDLGVLKALIAKYGIDSFSVSSNYPQQENLKKELLSSVHLVKSFLCSNSTAHQDQWTQSESSYSSLEDAAGLSSRSEISNQSTSTPSKVAPSISMGTSLVRTSGFRASADPPFPLYPSQSCLQDTEVSTFIHADASGRLSDAAIATSGSADEGVSVHNRQQPTVTHMHSEHGVGMEPLRLAPPALDCSGSSSGAVQTPSTGYAPSSVSSSVSRLSDKLKLANSKSQYECLRPEKKIAELELQRYELTLKMKDEEIEYWKSLAESAQD